MTSYFIKIEKLTNYKEINKEIQLQFLMKPRSLGQRCRNDRYKIRNRIGIVKEKGGFI